LADHAATMCIETERRKASQLNGESPDLEALVRVTNCLIRTPKELGTRGKEAKPITLEQHLGDDK
jgi:hypothetical protein